MVVDDADELGEDCRNKRLAPLRRNCCAAGYARYGLCEPTRDIFALSYSLFWGSWYYRHDDELYFHGINISRGIALHIFSRVFVFCGV